MDLSHIPIFVLCGGMGTRLREETEFRPKPMVTIGKHPILWHILRSYSRYGFKRFILCLGYKSEMIKSYFHNFFSLNSDCTINLLNNRTIIHESIEPIDWEITMAYTGEKSMTGSRIAQAAKKYLGESEHFGVTYGDGLTDVNLADEFQFHLKHQKIGTILGVNPPSRFGELEVTGDQVMSFREKPDFEDEWINGGYFFFRKHFLTYLSEDENCVLERAPLFNLAKDGQLMVYKHKGFWACMDTQRDRDTLVKMVEDGNTPWLTKK
ncbi:glucose-1-phosphate cytidylyltransferase [Methylacidiphilum caldifontis]|uniref:glucose-1-phosphate cytidylyltransferase n=1 Tax=Methylacidiphilum caldifontis TaxID=2795386 RepID=UPI00106C2F70|nr:glucose-1-phosphate cytidylyltransferase [Methylacidiphilum caldifontis]QSR89448.1 glucose-1-phosphate cytidylyltransferase [Methylacidiphilum caldifontis]